MESNLRLSRNSSIQIQQSPFQKTSKYVLVKILSYIFDLTTDIRNGTLKIRGVSQRWNEVVIAALEIQKNKDFFRNHHPFTSLSPSILELRSELKDILHDTQIQLENFCPQFKEMPSQILLYQVTQKVQTESSVQNSSIVEPHIYLTQRLNELMDLLFGNSRQKLKFQPCFDSKTGLYYFKMQDIFNIQYVNNHQQQDQNMLLAVNMPRMKKLFEHPYIEYQRFLRTKKQIQTFVNKVKEVLEINTQNQMYCKKQGFKEGLQIIKMIYENLIVNFHDKSTLHQQVFKHVMFAKFRAQITQISIQLEHATRFYL
eukprot:403353213